MQIRLDDLSGPEIIELLHEHLRCMARVSPPQSRHALNLDGLRKPGITFWTIWNGTDLAGCGAMKELDEQHGEIKSMRTAYVCTSGKASPPKCFAISSQKPNAAAIAG